MYSFHMECVTFYIECNFLTVCFACENLNVWCFRANMFSRCVVAVACFYVAVLTFELLTICTES